MIGRQDGFVDWSVSPLFLYPFLYGLLRVGVHTVILYVEHDFLPS